MITIKEHDVNEFYPTLERWLKAHKSEDVPERIIDRIFVAESGPVQIASLCLYLCSHGKIAVLEWLCTNPSVCFSKDLVLAVKALYTTLEDVARDAGCVVTIGWIEPNSSEERIAKSIGYQTSDQGFHKLYAKPLVT
jgi:hypothetical protein